MFDLNITVQDIIKNHAERKHVAAILMLNNKWDKSFESFTKEQLVAELGIYKTVYNFESVIFQDWCFGELLEKAEKALK